MHRRRLIAGLVGLAAASKAKPVSARTRRSNKGTLLSIGVSEYDHAPDLPSAVSDARLVSKSFRDLGYQTTTVENPTQLELLETLAQLQSRTANMNLIIFYVAAHGFLLNGKSYFLAKDHISGSRNYRQRPIPEALLINVFAKRARQRVLFLDTCRNSPLSQPDPGPQSDSGIAGTHVCYAAQPGAPAFDGRDLNSPFATALGKALSRSSSDLPELCRQIRLDVLRKTAGLQIPWEKSSLLRPIKLN